LIIHACASSPGSVGARSPGVPVRFWGAGGAAQGGKSEAARTLVSGNYFVEARDEQLGVTAESDHVLRREPGGNPAPSALWLESAGRLIKLRM
jgi:hypothetical protein